VSCRTTSTSSSTASARTLIAAFFAALKGGGLLCACGYTAGMQAQPRMLTMVMWVARL
jgi:hypothetical protein